MTDTHRSIHGRFAEEGVGIAFPQRDLHLDTNAPLHVTVNGVGQAPSGEVA